MSEKTKPPEVPAAASRGLVRPVRCWFCNQPMHYAGNPRHKPEVRVEVYANCIGMPSFSEFYAHVRCWSAAIMPNTKLRHGGENL